MTDTVTPIPIDITSSTPLKSDRVRFGISDENPKVGGIA